MQDLFGVICSGGSFRTAAISGNSDKGFISQQLFAVDIDNAKDKAPIPEADRLTPEQAIDRARQNKRMNGNSNSIRTFFVHFFTVN